jgi:hypothetical protein
MDLQTFKRKDTLLTDDFPQREYTSRASEQKNSVHIGQLKLLLSEISFLTLFLTEEINPIVVYAGAAPGNHIPILSDLFPEIEFHLYDPSPFKINPSNKIKIYNQYFLDKDALDWKNKKNVYFISDIRTSDYHVKTEEENEDAILGDMKMQANWVDLMEPTQSLLKFRLPYAINQVFKKYGETIEYFDGYVFFQAYAGQSSTETRLVPIRGTKKLWNFKLYESQMFYLNSIVREKFRYYNPFFGDDTPVFGEGHVNDFDDRLMAQIIIDYLEKKLCISDKLLKSFYDILMKDLFGKDEVLDLRKKIDKSSGKQYYNKKGFTRAFLFSVFDPSKSGTPDISGFVIRVLSPNQEPYFIFNNTFSKPSFFTLSTNKWNQSSEYFKLLTEELERDFLIPSTDLDKVKKQLFTLFDDDLLLFVVTVDISTLNKNMEDIFIKSKIDPSVKIVAESELKNTKFDDMMTKHINTYEKYKDKL